MIGLLIFSVLRMVLAPLVRLALYFFGAMLVAVGLEMAAERWVDGTMPRWVALALVLILGCAFNLMRRRWRLAVASRRAAQGSAGGVAEAGAGPGRISLR